MYIRSHSKPIQARSFCTHRGLKTGSLISSMINGIDLVTGDGVLLELRWVSDSSNPWNLGFNSGSGIKTVIEYEERRDSEASVARSGASKLRYAMSCIDMPEVAYLYRYLLVSARVYTSDCTPTSCRSGACDSITRPSPRCRSGWFHLRGNRIKFEGPWHP